MNVIAVILPDRRVVDVSYIPAELLDLVQDGEYAYHSVVSGISGVVLEDKHMPTSDLYWQRNPLYADIHYGLPQASKDSTIPAYGCKLCVYGLILGIDPITLQKMFSDNFVYANSGTFNYILDAQVEKIFGDRIVYTGRVDCTSTPAPLVRVDDMLKRNGFCMVYVDYSTAPGLQQHYVLIEEKTADGNYIIYDPFYNERVPITNRYGKTPDIAICGIIFLDVVRKPRNENPVSPTLVPTN